MNYTCLGNDNYEITLTIFRDCYNGEPWFDDPASIGIFDGFTNALIDEELIELTAINDTLDPILSSECFVAPPDVCVHTTTYTTVVNLPPQSGGYYLAYQRCCRNYIINNIVAPDDTGATYGVFISEAALQECNSNAQFQNWPPIYICVNEPISFDQSAVDIDGDSIVYKLCTPLQGATPADPVPQPPNNPPYDPVVWLPPNYGVNNMLNGTGTGDFLAINSETGLLTGTPNTQGVFVVGICVDEFRDESLISTTRRDFQFNVGLCGETISSFFAPDIWCDGLTVNFDNQSNNADDFEWYFDWPNSTTPESFEENGIFTYPDTGDYTIMLIAEPNDFCVDTFFQDITLEINSLTVDFEVEQIECGDSIVIEITDATTDTIASPLSWDWQLSTGQSSDEQNPTFVLSNTGFVDISLTVLADNGCEETFTQNLFFKLITEEIGPDTIATCSAEPILLNPVFDDSYDYQWSPANLVSNPNIGNPIGTAFETTTFSVTITDDGGCEIIRDITAFVPEIVTAELPNDSTFCATTVDLVAETNTGVLFFWSQAPNPDDIFSEEQAISIEPLGEETYYVLVRDSIGCIAMDSITLIGNGVNVLTNPTTAFCEGETMFLAAVNTDSNDVLEFEWSPASLISSNPNTAITFLDIPDPGVYPFVLNTENQFGCTRSDTLEVTVIDTTDQASFVFDIQCSDFNVQFTNTSINAEYVIWNFGDPNNPTASSDEANPLYSYSEEGIYEVMMVLDPDLPCPDTIIRMVEVVQPMIFPNFDFEYEECSDSVTIAFTDMSINNQSTIESWNWSFSNGTSADNPNPSVLLIESQTLVATLTVTSDDGCEDSVLEILEVNLIDVSLQDTVLVCLNESTPINPNPNFNYQYNWSPAESLDDASSPNPIATPLVSTNYMVTITDYSEDTCQIERSVYVFVPDPIEIELTNDTTVCEDVFELSAMGVGVEAFEWADNPSLSPVLSNASTFTTNLDRENIFYVTAFDEYGCRMTDSVNIASQSPSLNYQDTIIICLGDTVAVSVENENLTDDLTYDWSTNATIVAGQGTNELTVFAAENSVLNLSTENQFGCQEVAEIVIIVDENTPQIFAQAQPDTIYLGESTQLFTTEGFGYELSWSPSISLNNSTIWNPVATPDETTDYSITATNQSGCATTVTVRVVVLDANCDDEFVFVPNAFTPNGDGANDVFRARSNIVEEFSLIIYDRWGEEVFRTNDFDEGWDGTFKGEPLGADVYGYYLEATCIGEEVFVKKGNVTLIR